jgi:hypothetical protein
MSDEELRDQIDQLERQIRAAGLVPVTRRRSDDTAFKTLWALVTSQYPCLQEASDRSDHNGEHIEQFKFAIRYMSQVRRAPSPDTRYYTSYWIDQAEAWLRAQGYAPSIRTHVFTAAAIVCGVPYAPLDRYPHDLAFGLTLGGIDRPDTTWRETLRLRQILPPTKIGPQRSTNEGQGVSVFGGGHLVGPYGSW